MKPCLQATGIAAPCAASVSSNSRRHWFLAATAALLLAACGGGGDAPPTTPYAVNAAQHHLLADGGSWRMNGTGPNGVAFTIAMSFAPATAAPFPFDGVVAARSIETLTIQAAGQSDTVAQTIYFDAADLSIRGSESGGACSVATANAALPTSAMLGAGGAMFSSRDLDGCIGTSTLVSTTTATWSLEADHGVVLLCWNLAARDVSGAADATQSSCVEIAADGSLGTRARFALSAMGLVITAKNF